MNDLEVVFKSVAEGLKAFAKGIDNIADRLDTLAEQPDGAAAPEKEKTERPARETKKSKTTRSRKKTTRKSKKKSATDVVHNLIIESQEGVNIETLSQQSGYDPKKIYNIVYRLKKQGKIKSGKKGIYIAA